MLDHEAFWTGGIECDGGAAGGGGKCPEWSSVWNDLGERNDDGNEGGIVRESGDGVGAIEVWASVRLPPTARGLADAPPTGRHQSRGRMYAASSSSSSSLGTGTGTGTGIGTGTGGGASAAISTASSSSAGIVGGGSGWDVHVHVNDIASVAPCADDSLPHFGYAFHVGLKSGRGHFFVAPSKVGSGSRGGNEFVVDTRGHSPDSNTRKSAVDVFFPSCFRVIKYKTSCMTKQIHPLDPFRCVYCLQFFVTKC